jgi:LPXTG-motif cell wall-anchored protein
MTSPLISAALWIGAIVVLALLVVRRRQRKSNDF